MSRTATRQDGNSIPIRPVVFEAQTGQAVYPRSRERRDFEAGEGVTPFHLDEISRNVAEGAHAVLLLDRAGWHTTGKLDMPDNITPIFPNNENTP